jgi:hypothetical protein
MDAIAAAKRPKIQKTTFLSQPETDNLAPLPAAVAASEEFDGNLFCKKGINF